MDQVKKISVILILLSVAIGAYFYSKSAGKPEETKSSPPPQSVAGYQGKVLAGSSSLFLEFNKTDYEKALSEEKIIFLDFYANWCPICRAEAPAIHEGFEGLTTDKVIGFRINYNDSETDSNEKALAKQFNITYQHTKVILKMGKEVLKSLDSWNKETFSKEIEKVL